jgi:fimbrial chaperone protein
MRRAEKIATLCAVAILGTVQAFGFTLEPMSALLAPSGAGSVATFRIKNDGTARIALRLSVLSRRTSPDGQEENAPAEKLFALYPSRLLIEPGASAAAKVQWRGPAAIDAERCFRFVAEQVAIDAEGAKSSGIRIMFRYIASLYVGDSRFKPELSAKALGAEGPQGEKGLLLEVENGGTRHVIALEMKISLLEPDAPPLLISSEELGGLNAANYLPGSSRTLFLPREDAEIGKRYDARIDYESEF